MNTTTAPQPIIINNSAAAAASAGGSAGRRKQSFWAHLWLLLFTGGIGNIIYGIHVAADNRRRGW